MGDGRWEMGVGGSRIEIVVVKSWSDHRMGDGGWGKRSGVRCQGAVGSLPRNILVCKLGIRFPFQVCESLPTDSGPDALPPPNSKFRLPRSAFFPLPALLPIFAAFASFCEPPGHSACKKAPQSWNLGCSCDHHFLSIPARFKTFRPRRP
jgi:hypothetical protein